MKQCNISFLQQNDTRHDINGCLFYPSEMGKISQNEPKRKMRHPYTHSYSGHQNGYQSHKTSSAEMENQAEMQRGKTFPSSQLDASLPLSFLSALEFMLLWYPEYPERRANLKRLLLQLLKFQH